MVQKPRIQNGKIVSRGHWYNCEEVKRRGTHFVMDPKEIEVRVVTITIQLRLIHRPPSIFLFPHNLHSIEDTIKIRRLYIQLHIFSA